ncbi:hypothetical protein C7M84_002221 [Penaeus vannamei]|uniref:Uncharacterized protein n=1 Tax=Penaeus vannamei TaxID=6689 RepID=A0A3R7MDN6_PENVA|nr:hypothetical protein C7M84_002221 [Penaeus vannamei]
MAGFSPCPCPHLLYGSEDHSSAPVVGGVDIPPVCRVQSAVIFFSATRRAVGQPIIVCGRALHGPTACSRCLPCPAIRPRSQGLAHQPRRTQDLRPHHPWLREEVAEQPPRLPPPVTVSTQRPAPVASYLAPVLGGQPDADAGDRRDTLGHQWVTTATSREPASSSASGLQPPPPMLSGSVPGPAAHPPTQYGPHLQQATPVSQPPAHLHMAPPVVVSCIPPYSQSVPARQCDHTCPRSTLAIGRDELPIFCGEMPASQGIQRSQELESWISSIELSTRPAISEAYIRMARSRVSRYAWSVLNSPVFANIQDWVSFQAQLQDQFRGVATAQHFYEMHGQARMVVGQGPLDLFRAVEPAVQQGVRDYPQDIGNAKGLMQPPSGKDYQVGFVDSYSGTTSPLLARWPRSARPSGILWWAVIEFVATSA